MFYEIAVWVLAVEGIYLGTLLVSSLLVWILLPAPERTENTADAKIASAAMSSRGQRAVRSWIIRSSDRPAAVRRRFARGTPA